MDERLREAEFRDAYRTRDNMSTKALKSKIARLEAEQRFKQLVEAPEKARLEALQKKKQARLAFIGKVGSAALDVYSKAPSSIAGRNLSGQAAKDAIEAFKKRQEWAKAFKDVPTTMTKFTQSINVGGVDVYIPETIQNRFMIQHTGRKGMKWGMNIFGKRDRYARNNFSKEHYQTYKYVRERVKKGKSEYKLSKKIHRLTKDLYDSQPTEQNRLLTNVAYDARKDAKTTRKKYKGSVKKIFNKYSETDFDLKGGLTQSGANMGEIINGVYIPSQDDLLLHYGKKGMKWKKHLTNGVNSALEGIENVANWVDDQTFDKNRDRALRDRSESNKRRINDPKYGKTYNTASDPVDGKKNVDVKRALREGRDNVVPSRSREGMRQENKYIEKIRKRVNLPRLKQGISSEDTLLHYGKKGMKWKKKGKPGSAPMSAAEMAAMEERIKKEEKSYNYNLQMRDKAIENALKRGASGKEIRRLQDMRADDQRKVDMNKKHKEAMKKKDNRRSSYDRSVEVIDATNPKKPKSKTYKY
ncbi:MAG: hypothetical protein HXM02_05685 [[Eubacterium] sulci]|nr:hypothetical protein [[Eubacterium] sulci]